VILGLVRFRTRAGGASHDEPEQRDVAVLDDVVLPRGADEALLPGSLLGPGGDEVVPGEGLGADEPPLEVAVDVAGGLRRARALADGPGADLLLARGEEADQVEEPVTGADQPPKAGLREAELLEEHLALLGR